MQVEAVKTVREQVTNSLRSLILEGSYAPGNKLKQDELAASFGVSLVPVREALRQLHAEGLVELAPRRGAFIPTFTLDELIELSHIREELEVLALRQALGRISTDDVQELNELLGRIEDAESHLDVGLRSTVIREFLWTLFDASGWPHLLELIRRLYNMTYLYLRQYSAAFHLSEQRIANYGRMLRAIADRDVDAVVAAHRENYRLFRETMGESFQQREAAGA